jgi:hypothetical protein
MATATPPCAQCGAVCGREPQQGQLVHPVRHASHKRARLNEVVIRPGGGFWVRQLLAIHRESPRWPISLHDRIASLQGRIGAGTRGYLGDCRKPPERRSVPVRRARAQAGLRRSQRNGLRPIALQETPPSLSRNGPDQPMNLAQGGSRKRSWRRTDRDSGRRSCAALGGRHGPSRAATWPRAGSVLAITACCALSQRAARTNRTTHRGMKCRVVGYWCPWHRCF